MNTMTGGTLSPAFKPHFLREEEKQLWQNFMTAALMGGASGLEAARNADQAVAAFYARFDFVLVRVHNTDPEPTKMWVRNTREQK